MKGDNISWMTIVRSSQAAFGAKSDYNYLAIDLQEV